MTGIYGIDYYNNYSLTGNYGYGYSTGAVSSAQPEEKGVVLNPMWKSPAGNLLPQNVRPARTANIRTVPMRWSLSNLHPIYLRRLPLPEFAPMSRSM